MTTSKSSIIKALLIIGISIILVVIIGITIAYSFIGRQALSVMLFLTALIAYFGILIVPGGWKEGEGFSESRIRLAITSAFLVVYLAYFSTVIFWSGKEALPPLANKMIETLTDLLSIVLPFYFGVTGAVEILKDRSKNGAQKN
jgi:hypothetical protein